MLGDDVALSPVLNVGIAELHTRGYGLTKSQIPCHLPKTLRLGTKITATTTQCKTLTKARITYILDKNELWLLSFVAQ